MPHLCKEIHCPGVTKKKTVNPDEEPDFYEISKMFAVPEEAPKDSRAQVMTSAMAKSKISCTLFNLWEEFCANLFHRYKEVRFVQNNYPMETRAVSSSLAMPGSDRVLKIQRTMMGHEHF